MDLAKEFSWNPYCILCQIKLLVEGNHFCILYERNSHEEEICYGHSSLVGVVFYANWFCSRKAEQAPAPAGHFESPGTVLEEQVARAERDHESLIIIQDADTSGYSAEVVNGTVRKDAGAVTVEGPKGESVSLPTERELANGETIEIEYSVRGNQLFAEYSKEVNPELVDAVVF